MNPRQLTWMSLIALAGIAGGFAIAQDHDHDRDLWRRHPNLAQAERLTHQADGYLQAAQRANHWDLHGHAQHAEELLQQADREIWEAARDADHR
jgi:hypothetical protein